MKTTRAVRHYVRRGFTLIEVLIALSLSLILISAIYSAVSLHWRFEQAGRERIDRAQLSLAVLRLLAEDVGSVEFTPPAAVVEDDSSTTGTASTGAGSGTGTGGGSGDITGGGTDTGGGTGSSSGSSTSMSGANSTASVIPAKSSSLGIIGTADRLQLDISHPVRQDFIAESSTATDGATTTSLQSDTVRVTWALVTPTTSTTQDSSGLRSLTVNPALARQLQDRLRAAVDDEVDTDSANSSELKESSILAREIVSLQFQYYDGYAWATEWDSVEKERLPRAIEVTIGFLESEYKKPGAFNLPGQQKITTIKHVILVPASSPVSGEEL